LLHLLRLLVLRPVLICILSVVSKFAIPYRLHLFDLLPAFIGKCGFVSECWGWPG
jgi:hypothetical protein